MKRAYLLDRIAIMLGGRAAERIQFGDLSTGAGDDLKKATELAQRMVCQWGMSESVGPVVFKRGQRHPFLGRELTEEKDFSEETAYLIDQEIRENHHGNGRKSGFASEKPCRTPQCSGERPDGP